MSYKVTKDFWLGAGANYQHLSATLTNNVKDEELMGMGDRGIMLSGGTLNLHGDRTNTWTKLAATAAAGATSIQVLNAAGWRVGDEIVLASTDFDPRQAERRTISAISGNTITLDKPLDYMHFGKITFDVDERGEVGLLTRNIKLQASADAEQSFYGGHVMAMVGSKMFVEGVELNRMGQNLQLARYPIHWHLVGDAKGQYIKNASIHDTYNRCVTVHGTNNLHVENNVTYNTVGHCFFMEDGIEHGNEFVHNLAIQTKCHTSKPCVPTNLAANGENLESNPLNRATYRAASMSGKDTLLPSDNTVAAYWITNPDNVFIDNVAAGSDENGFWWSLPEHPQGKFEGTEISKNTWPRRTKMAEFRGNVAHSNFDGFMFDRNIYEDNTFGLATIPFLPLTNPADLDSEVVETHFESLTSYKNRNGGLWGRGDMYVYSNAKFADNAIGMTQAAGDIGSLPFSARLVDSLVVGETENIGNPSTPEEIAYGRSLPKPAIPDFPIRGYEYYDYRDDVVNTTFVNFQDNKLRKTGALSFLLFTSAGLSTGSSISGAKFVNAKPVYFPKYDARFDNDNRGGAQYRTLSFRDLDGSVTGIPDSHVMLNDGENDSVVTDDTCKIEPTWNASVCKGDIGRLNLSDARGELPRAVNLESRTARFALLASIGGGAASNNPLVQAQRTALFSRRAPQPPIAPPPDPANESTERDDTADDDAAGGLSALATWSIRGGVTIAALLSAAAAMSNSAFTRCMTFHSLSKRSSLPGLRSAAHAPRARPPECMRVRSRWTSSPTPVGSIRSSCGSATIRPSTPKAANPLSPVWPATARSYRSAAPRKRRSQDLQKSRRDRALRP